MDKREYINDQEEQFRTVVAGLMRGFASAMPCLMSQDTTDGHRCVPQPSIKRAITDPTTGQVSYEDHPPAVDVPISFSGGKNVVATHPVAQGDEGVIVYADRSLDATLQQGGTAQPMDDRQHHLGDGIYIPGIRSDPRKLQQVDNTAHHVRSVDKRHVSELHPDSGAHVKSVDPSTAPASETFDPFTQATTFFEHLVHPTNGIAGNATDGGTTHSHGVDHTTGPFMRAVNALHSVLVDPQNGPSMNAKNMLVQVLAHPLMGAMLNSPGGSVTAGLGGVSLQSGTSISLSAPSLSMPAGSAASNVGSLGGDLNGSLPNPQVVSLAHVNGQQLIAATSDATAATAGVPLYGVYRNTSVSTGLSVLCVRVN